MFDIVVKLNGQSFEVGIILTLFLSTLPCMGVWPKDDLMLKIDVVSQAIVVDDLVQVELAERFFGDGWLQTCCFETVSICSF